MLSRLNFFCGGQSDEVQYLPVAGGVVVAPVEQDNTDLFNQIPVDVLVLIATKLPQKDLIPFFLISKRLFRLFEDFKSNARISSLRVFMPTSRQSLYQGAPADVNFRDVNHVLMAQYFMNIKMHDLEAHAGEIMSQDRKRACVALGISTTLGIAIGIAIHAGAAVLLDRVVLPACFKYCVTNSVSVDTGCGCGGNILTATDPVTIGRYFDVYGNVVTRTMKLAEYQACNIACCYIPAPLPASLSVGCVIGQAPFCKPCSDLMLGERYDAKHNKLNGVLEKMNSSNKNNFIDIITLNTQLRERKLGGASYGMFKPAILKMDDDEPQIVIDNHDINAPQEPPQRMMME